MIKERLSNIELARVISMFFILIIHANMVSLSKPTLSDLEQDVLPTLVRYLIESVGIISVNVFVLISGWFTVKSRKENILSFLYQVFFLWGGIYIIFLITGTAEFNIKNVLTCIAFTNWDWFIKAYLFLFIIAPILNSFVKNSTEKIQRNVLIGYFIYSSTYGFFGGASRFFGYGYGPLFFIGLYLLAQYVRNTSHREETPHIIKNLFTLNKWYDLLICVISMILNTLIGIVALKMNIPLYGHVYAYLNPLVVIGSLYFLLFFSKLHIQKNKFINWLGTSSFAVYLIHSQIDMRPYFTYIIQYIYSSYSGFIVILYIGLFLILVYLISVLIDQIRIFSWNLIGNNIKL